MLLSEFTKVTQDLLFQNGVKLSQQDTKTAIDTVLKSIAANVDEHGLTFIGFGKFAVKTRSARSCRNPRTGETIQVPEKRVVGFKSKIVK
jgi:nucleoid DNA-binding protein